MTSALGSSGGGRSPRLALGRGANFPDFWASSERVA